MEPYITGCRLGLSFYATWSFKITALSAQSRFLPSRSNTPVLNNLYGRQNWIRTLFQLGKQIHLSKALRNTLLRMKIKSSTTASVFMMGILSWHNYEKKTRKTLNVFLSSLKYSFHHTLRLIFGSSRSREGRWVHYYELIDGMFRVPFLYLPLIDSQLKICWWC